MIGNLGDLANLPLHLWPSVTDFTYTHIRQVGPECTKPAVFA